MFFIWVGFEYCCKLWLRKEKYNINRLEIVKIFVLLNKDLKIIMLKDIVVNIYENMNEDMRNFCREVDIIMIIKNKIEKLDWKILEWNGFIS